MPESVIKEKLEKSYNTSGAANNRTESILEEDESQSDFKACVETNTVT